jgi:hypothetical protein
VAEITPSMSQNKVQFSVRCVNRHHDEGLPRYAARAAEDIVELWARG